MFMNLLKKQTVIVRQRRYLFTRLNRRQMEIRRRREKNNPTKSGITKSCFFALHAYCSSLEFRYFP